MNISSILAHIKALGALCGSLGGSIAVLQSQQAFSLVPQKYAMWIGLAGAVAFGLSHAIDHGIDWYSGNIAPVINPPASTPAASITKQ
jgi:hypothetical protein